VPARLIDGGGRRSLAALLGAAVLALGLGVTPSARPSVSEARAAGPSVVRVAADEPSTLDPAAAGDTTATFVIPQLFETLTAFDTDLVLRPALARAWGVADVCGRGREVTFLNVNGDRWPDLFLGNQTPRDDPDDPCNAPGNTLPNEMGKVFVNVRGDHFRYVRDLWDFGAGIGVRCAEVNSDVCREQ